MGNINQRKLKEPSFDTKQVCWVNYSTEALIPVDKEVTEVLFEIADAMGNDIKTGLHAKNIYTDFHVIGSLASQTHIQHKETIDLVIFYKSKGNSTTNPKIEDIVYFVIIRKDI